MNIRRLTLFLMLAVLCIAGAERASAFYNPGTGRWLSRDPIGESGGVNVYQYVLNDPVSLYDPDGMAPRDGRNPGSDFAHDDEGVTLLAYWLSGYGQDQIIKSDNNQWHGYMVAVNSDTQPLRDAVKRKMTEDYNKRRLSPSGDVNITMRGEFVNGEDAIGYHYLHTSNPVVGDFQIKGPAKAGQGSGCPVNYELSYTWNDVIGPNKNYTTDQIKALFGRVISLGNAKNYRVEIHFDEKLKIHLDDGGKIKAEGWPWAPSDQ